MPKFTETRGGTELGWLARNPSKIPQVAKAAGIDPAKLTDAVQGRLQLSPGELERLKITYDPDIYMDT